MATERGAVVNNEHHHIECDLDEDCTCEHAPSTITLEVHDIIVSSRKVQVSNRCPRCRESLVGEGVLKHFEYQLQERRVDVVPNDHEGGYAVDWGVHDVKGGEGEFASEWQCPYCGCTLLEHTVEEVDGE